MNISDIKRMGIIFPVYDRIGDQVAYIRPVNNVGMIIPYVDKIVKSRNEMRESFYFQGLVTPESTMKYFRSIIYDDHDRVQFVLNFCGNPVGNYGLHYCGERLFELDNALNWTGVKGMFGYFDRLLYDIAFTLLGAKVVQAKVLSSNEKVIKWHEKGGMRNVSVRPMILDKVFKRYRETDEGEIPNTPMTVTVMEIRKEWWKK